MNNNYIKRQDRHGRELMNWTQYKAVEVVFMAKPLHPHPVPDRRSFPAAAEATTQKCSVFGDGLGESKGWGGGVGWGEETCHGTVFHPNTVKMLFVALCYIKI